MGRWFENFQRKRPITEAELLALIEIPVSSEDEFQVDSNDDLDVDPNINPNNLEVLLRKKTKNKK